MPFKGFVCELDGRCVCPEACLKCSHRRQVNGENTCHFPPPIIAGIIESNQPRELMGYSATELIGCHRRVVLQEEVDYWVKPSQAYWAFRGQLGHAIVERFHDGNGARTIAEERFYAEMDGMLITGQPDVIYPDDRLLVDYKTAKRVPQSTKRYVCPKCEAIIRESPWKVRRGAKLKCECCGAEHADLKPEILPPRPYDTHVQQLNVYAWLLAENDVLVETAQVVYLDMSEPFPVPVEVWPLAETESYIRRQLTGLLERDENGLPAGVWDDPEANWLCRYCAVESECARRRRSTESAEEVLDRGRRLLRGDPEDETLI